MAYIITVSNPGSGNRYYVDSVLQQQLSFQEGSTHRFDQSDSSNSGHPLRLSATANGTHGGGSEYTTGVTTSGTPGQAGAYTEITVAYGAPTLYYYCTAHSGMGGQVKIEVLKNFELNGPVVVGKDTKVTVGTVTSGAVDLSTGNYFVDSPSGAYTYSFTNPGAVQAFQIEATGGSEAVSQTFNTTLYTGINAINSVNTGIDLAGDGGLVWIKSRNDDNSSAHNIYDTARGVNRPLSSHTTGGDYVAANSLTSFNTTGFTVGNQNATNSPLDNFVAWTFKKQTKFFDIVTYAGDGDFTGRTISHSLGSVPGMIIIKKTSHTADWIVYHRSEGATKSLELNNTNGSNTYNMFNDTAPTATEFSVSSYSKVNNNGDTYVAYLFAHDTASDGLIQCGSYTGNGAATGVFQNLGWQPQWLLIKNTDLATEQWFIFDSARGVVTGGSDAVLEASRDIAEFNADIVDFPTNGFTPISVDDKTNGSGHNYVYVAIRSASAPAITWPTSIEWTQGTTPKTPAEGATDVYTFTTDDGGTTYTGIQSIDTAS